MEQPFNKNVLALARDIANKESKIDLDNYTEEELELVKRIPCLSPTIDIQKFLKKIRAKVTLNSVERILPDFILLLQYTNLSPIKCAEMVEVSWFKILEYADKMDREGNPELGNTIKIAKKAYAESVMMHPENYKGNSSMAIFLAKSLAGWSDDTKNSFGVPSSQELDQILKAREELMTQFEELENIRKIA